MSISSQLIFLNGQQIPLKFTPPKIVVCWLSRTQKESDKSTETGLVRYSSLAGSFQIYTAKKCRVLTVENLKKKNCKQSRAATSSFRSLCRQRAKICLLRMTPSTLSRAPICFTRFPFPFARQWRRRCSGDFMGWSLLPKNPCKRDYILQKRRIIFCHGVATISRLLQIMGWLWPVRSFKSLVSFAKEHCKRDPWF